MRRWEGERTSEILHCLFVEVGARGRKRFVGKEGFQSGQADRVA
jgi:hypothetical protein